tara:strand:- start:161 stop:595 length:435 start_codon:yes stop_codon:yes gene_type:complete
MKKLFYIFILSSFLISCAEDDPYSFSIDAKNGNDIERVVKFNISSKIVDSLKIERFWLISIAKKAARYADWGVKNELTYDFRNVDDALNMIYISDDRINVSVKGKADNSFGVSGKLTSIVAFDIETKEMIMDKNDLPEVVIIDF